MELISRAVSRWRMIRSVVTITLEEQGFELRPQTEVTVEKRCSKLPNVAAYGSASVKMTIKFIDTAVLKK